MWLGCLSSLCFFAAIDAIANAFNQSLYIFSGVYFWKWNSYSDYPKVRNAILLKPEFRYIDAAYMNTESNILYVIKGNEIFPFNDNNYNKSQVKKISEKFVGFQSDSISDLDATRFDIKKKQIYFFKVCFND